MTEAALTVLYRAVFQRLTAPGELWGSRAFPMLAAEGTERPYVVFSFAAGGEVNQHVKQDAEIVLTVKGVAEQLSDAQTIAARISTLLNDADASSVTALDVGAFWDVLYTKQEQIVHLLEVVDGTWLYHEGNRYRFRMEAR